jgi:hypothetical protein
VAYKNDKMIFLHHQSHSSYGATIQEFFFSADKLIYMHEYTVNQNCYEGHIICINEYKHYFNRNEFISGMERRSRIPLTEAEQYDPPFYKATLEEVPFENMNAPKEAITKSDQAKLNQARMQWEAMQN